MSGSPGRMLGRYRLERLLGRGGMAEVWLAVDTKLGRAVAVKLILAGHASDPGFLTRFLREARLVAALEHPNILPVYDFGEEDGAPFLVMPYLEGGTLRDRMLGGPTPPALAVLWVGQLGGALDAAHEAGVLHRDVKPANVLVGRGDRAFLADFGIARMLDASAGLTTTGMVMGTPLYMAPEQAQGHPATPATDRYALAVIAWELLAGKPPFLGESPLSLMHQHVTTPPPALSTRIAGLPPGLDGVFARALAKDPRDRHPTCTAFAAALESYVPTGVSGGAPPAAVPATAPTVVTEPRPEAEGRTETAPLRPGLRRPVATPPAGLTSDRTVFTGSGRARRKLAWGVVAAVVAIAGGVLLLGRSGPPPAAGIGVAKSVGAPPAGPSKDYSSERGPGISSTPAAAAPAALPRPGSPSGKPPVSSPSPAREPSKPAAPTPAAEVRPSRSPAATRLKPALDRLDVSRKPGRRLSKEDFEYAVQTARTALRDDPELAEARTLDVYGRGGLAYVAFDDGAASQAVVEAFAGMKREGHQEVRGLAFLLRGPGGSIVPPRGWELALAYGDARGEAEALLAAALERNPNDSKALLGRARVRLLQGRTNEALADLRQAAANGGPLIRQGVLEMLRSACRRGVAEACREADIVASRWPRRAGRN